MPSKFGGISVDEQQPGASKFGGIPVELQASPRAPVDPGFFSRTGQFLANTLTKTARGLDVTPMLEHIGHADDLAGQGRWGDAWNEIRDLLPGGSPSQQVLGNQHGTTLGEQRQFVQDTADKVRTGDYSGATANGLTALATNAQHAPAAIDAAKPFTDPVLDATQKTAQGAAPLVRGTVGAVKGGTAALAKGRTYGPAVVLSEIGRVSGLPHGAEIGGLIGAAPGVIRGIGEGWRAGSSGSPMVPTGKPSLLRPTAAEVRTFGTPTQAPDIPNGLDPYTERAPGALPMKSVSLPKQPKSREILPDNVPTIPPASSGTPQPLKPGIVFTRGSEAEAETKPLVQTSSGYSGKKSGQPNPPASGAPLPGEYIHAPAQFVLKPLGLSNEASKAGSLKDDATAGGRSAGPSETPPRGRVLDAGQSDQLVGTGGTPGTAGLNESAKSKAEAGLRNKVRQSLTTATPSSSEPETAYDLPTGSPKESYIQAAQTVKARQLAKALKIEGTSPDDAAKWTPEQWESKAKEIGINKPSSTSIQKALDELKKLHGSK